MIAGVKTSVLTDIRLSLTESSLGGKPPDFTFAP